MTQNLDHSIGDIDGGTYTPADTDIPVDWTPSSSEYTKSTGDTSWTSSSTTPSSYDPGNLYWDGTLNESWSGNLNNETVAEPSSTSGGTHYHIGNYYNWTAAVAMNDSSSYTTYQDVDQSICPAGWRLPTYNGDKSYQALVSAESLAAGTSGNVQSEPTYFVYSGYWYDYFDRGGIGGGYWSSVATRSGVSMFRFSVDGDLNTDGTSSPGHFGYSLRCVAR